ncbi:hypothetical protein Q1695_015696 [Nippostrongylus brasiliensis]|nr:hypothetical protein Q1695_015696 [Nippostrongylus brasiliensis]
MRNYPKGGPIHDAVRKEAVAPKPRQLVRKPRLLEPLSDPEDEEPQIVRSYVKPSKNIDTYNQMVREERQLNAMMKHSSPSSRATENKEPKRKRKSELFKRVFGNSLPPSVPRKSSSSLTSSRVSPPDRIPCYKKSHDSVRPQNLSRTPAHDVPVKRRKEDPEGSSKSRVTPAPHRLQVKSSALPIPSTSNSDHIRSHAPPVHREPKVVRENALKPVEKNQPRKTCHEVEAKRSRSSTAFRPVLEWNEHLNMAYLHKRRQKFFTLKSLPESESWYAGAFASATGEEHSSKRRADPVGSSSSPPGSIRTSSHPSSLPTFCCHSDSSGRQQEAKEEHAHIRVETGYESSSVQCGSSVCETSRLASADFPPSDADLQTGVFSVNGQEIHSECRRNEKRLSFSETLVTTYLYDQNTHCVWKQRNEDLAASSLHERSASTLAREELEDQRLGDFASVHKGDVSCDMGSSTLPLKSIKQEVVEDDEIEVLFSGRREYLEALRHDTLASLH